jgi:3-hydroxyisobutyrate dehydrogenase-like beta-hydroxyacid dehydrogenase
VISQTKADFLYADCNAIAPETTREIGDMITAAGGRYVDASIIGPPPTKEGINRFYVSGSEADTFKQLGQFGLDVIVLGDQIGMASAIKMCYGALNKEVAALGIEILTAAEALGVYQALQKELELSQSDLFSRLERQFASMSMKSRRFVGEMEEIAKTLGRVGLTPRIFDGAADLYQFVGTTELADRTPEDTSPPPGLTQMLSLLAGRLSKNAGTR